MNNPQKHGSGMQFPPQLSGLGLTFSSFSHTLYSCRSSSQTMLIQDILQHLDKTTKTISIEIAQELVHHEGSRSYHIVFLNLSRTLECSRSRSLSGRILTSWSSCGNNIWSRDKHTQQWKRQRRMKSTASGSSQHLARNMYQQLSHRWLQL